VTVGAAPTADAGAIRDRLEDVRRRIAAVGDPAAVRIVAVTKGFGSEIVTAAHAIGLADLGENYAQELITKARVAPAGITWHFLGAPQRNKVAKLAPLVGLWQAVDREAVVQRIAEVAPGAALLVQVNAVGDPGKAGCRPADAAGLVDAARVAGLDPRGLMVVGPAADPRGAARVFAEVAALGRGLGLAELSMGMTDDFEAAVAAGSTMVRLGRVLFGPRPGRGAVRR
jgi:pyridoxal phosphate enzyme (YggS family)